MTGFFARLEGRSRDAGTRLCVGIDPREPTAIEARGAARLLIAATAPSAAAFKFNSAYFEALGPEGMEALIDLVAEVPEEIPVILDAKRGDIAESAEAYARACFEVVGAGSVTLSPYLGVDSIRPFLGHDGAGVWVLARTSNPSATAVQDLGLAGGGVLHEEVVRLATTWAGPDRLGLVAGATDPGALARVRAAAPGHWILAPGVGAQGADPASLGVGLREDGSGLLVNVSRAIATADDPGGAAADLRGALASLQPIAVTASGESPLAVDLHAAGCVRFGRFTLRSGAESPVYLDLRRLISHPGSLRRVAAALFASASHLGGEAIGAVPYGGLPLATATALHGGLAMVWARPRPKDHGSGDTVEGDWHAGQRLVLVDDVATSGISALESARLLRDHGLIVEHLAVVVERSSVARSALAAEGIALHSLTTLRGLAEDLAAAGLIDEEQRRQVDAMSS